MLKWWTEWKQIWRTQYNKNVTNIPDGQIESDFNIYMLWKKKKEIPDHVKKRRQNNRRNDKNTPSQT